LAMGIQSASERIKKIFKRDYPNNQIEKSAKILNKFKNKIERICFEVIIDNPWQVEEDLIETLMLLSKLPVPYYLNVFSLTFYPGNELYEIAKKDGFIQDEIKNIYQKNYLNPNRDVYINKLFFLIKDFSYIGRRIYPIEMFLLTNKLCRKIYLSKILYFILANHIKGGWKEIIIDGQRKIRNFSKTNK